MGVKGEEGAVGRRECTLEKKCESVREKAKTVIANCQGNYIERRMIMKGKRCKFTIFENSQDSCHTANILPVGQCLFLSGKSHCLSRRFIAKDNLLFITYAAL